MFTHPNAQALLKTILANPDDDAPRLILADWLDENGFSERAEYIRLECEIDRDKFSDRSLELRRRRDAIWFDYRSAWSTELPNITGVGWAGYERGFCMRARLSTAKSFSRSINKIRKAAPVTHYIFSDRQSIGDLATMKGLQHLRGLSVSHLSSGCTDHELIPILQSPHLKALHHLGCGSTHISSKTIEVVADSPKCAGLRHLEIFLTKLWSGVAMLGRSRHFTALEELNFHTTIVPVKALEELAQSPVLRTLRRLRFGDPFGADGVRAIVNSPTMTNLKHFALVRPGEGTQCMRAIAESPNVTSWREMDIIGPIGVEGAEIIAQAANLAGLQGLSLLDSSINDDMLLALLKSPHLRNLRQLAITSGTFSDDVVLKLIDSPVLAKVEHLGLETSKLAPTTIQAIRDRFKNRVSYSTPGLYI